MSADLYGVGESKSESIVMLFITPPRPPFSGKEEFWGYWDTLGGGVLSQPVTKRAVAGGAERAFMRRTRSVSDVTLTAVWRGGPFATSGALNRQSFANAEKKLRAMVGARCRASEQHLSVAGNKDGSPVDTFGRLQQVDSHGGLDDNESAPKVVTLTIAAERR